MKKGKIISIINENLDKIYSKNMNEDSYYDGHKFVEYGKNIDNISLNMKSSNDEYYSIDKEYFIINWGIKFEFRNSGIEGIQINILNIETNLIIDSDSNNKKIPFNFSDYKFNVIKEKNTENNELQLFITSIEIDDNTKIVYVTVTI